MYILLHLKQYKLLFSFDIEIAVDMIWVRSEIPVVQSGVTPAPISQITFSWCELHATHHWPDK